MKKFYTLAALALAMAGCTKADENPQPQPQSTVTGSDDGQSDADECPRADGTPCR